MKNSKIILEVFILLANITYGQNKLFNFLSENAKTLTIYHLLQPVHGV
jgi:hypothetical protein